MPTHKIKIVITLVIIAAAVLLLAWQYVIRDGKEQKPTDNQTESQQTGSPALPGGVKFELGEVIRVETDKIFFTVSTGEEKTALLGIDTELKKQTRTANGVKVVDAQLSDFTKGVKIVVYYIEEPENGNYPALKIQNIELK
ncbi:MAG: hypothetical protein HYX22_01850 [Candidatus Yanofskybacteria bacterium]|nr:hypothetical protein [Candidatus Yanofskybacteria bacterium]